MSLLFPKANAYIRPRNLELQNMLGKNRRLWVIVVIDRPKAHVRDGL